MKIVNVERGLLIKLVLECEYEILNSIPLNTTNTISITDKNNCLIYIILLIIMCLIILAIVSISCYYYYTRYWLKKKNIQCHIKSINESYKKG